MGNPLSQNSASAPVSGDSIRIYFQIRGLGHVPSMKNCKMMTRGKLITKPERQEWMKQAIQSLQFQLRSAFQTIGDGTMTERQQRCLIALREHSTTFDDSRQWIPEHHVKTQLVAAGQEGCDIFIELLP